MEHRTTQVRRPRTNGFVERFNRTTLDEFFRETFPDSFYASIESGKLITEKMLKQAA
jgi:transposase InsO family protein